MGLDPSDICLYEKKNGHIKRHQDTHAQRSNDGEAFWAATHPQTRQRATLRPSRTVTKWVSAV